MSRIFVFGSNEAGRRGRGAALDAARHHGAIYGQGFGPSLPVVTADPLLKQYPVQVIW